MQAQCCYYAEPYDSSQGFCSKICDNGIGKFLWMSTEADTTIRDNVQLTPTVTWVDLALAVVKYVGHNADTAARQGKRPLRVLPGNIVCSKHMRAHWCLPKKFSLSRMIVKREAVPYFSTT
jgi:hypothetical protein